ncbi:MAG: succinylglutamate desuccinylase/aspartoacylase family protein [Polyangiales bacterium]
MTAYERTIGRVAGARPGPTLVAVAGMHGNEPGGVLAARRVLAALAGREALVRGELVAFTGNLGALRTGRRFVAKDFNRVWTRERVERLRRDPDAACVDAEDFEQRELLAELDRAVENARGEVYAVDLHTTSAAGTPFVIFGDTLRQRGFVLALPVPAILGLEELIDGVLAQHLTERGCVTFSVEGGQHDDPASVDNLEACLWLALESSGVLARNAVPELARSRALLDARRGRVPRVMEVLRRHAITPEDAFVMEPGFRNLHPVGAGQLLASDRRGKIRAPADGVVMLPLYQAQGADGFFWGRAVDGARIAASEVLRALGADRWLGRLPGVRRHRGEREGFEVDTRVARLYPLQVFHLFGYRRVRHVGDVLTVTRQPD